METELVKNCMKIIQSQNIIIENLQKNLDDYREEKNKQKMKNRLRVEKSKQKKKKEQCDELEGLLAVEGGFEREEEKKEGEKKEEGEKKGVSGRKKSGEVKGKLHEVGEKKKKRKKNKTGDFIGEDMIGVGEIAMEKIKKNDGGEGSQMMQWWMQPQGQCISQSIPPVGQISVEDGSGNYNNNNNNTNNGSGSDSGSGSGSGNGDYFSDQSNFYAQIGNIQFDQAAIDKILEGGKF